MKFISAFQNRDEVAGRVSFRYRHRELGQPEEIRVGKSQVTDFVVDVRIESGRDKNHFRLEFAQSR